MKIIPVLSAAAVAATLAAPAAAWEGQTVACYDKHWIPATYDVHKKLKTAERTTWEHKNGQVVKVYYAPMYIEHKHLKQKGHYVLRQAPCED